MYCAYLKFNRHNDIVTAQYIRKEWSKRKFKVVETTDVAWSELPNKARSTYGWQSVRTVTRAQFIADGSIKPEGWSWKDLPYLSL